ncbi:MAG: hypothetical protein ABF297_02085 [Thiogranum sp.]
MISLLNMSTDMPGRPTLKGDDDLRWESAYVQVFIAGFRQAVMTLQNFRSERQAITGATVNAAHVKVSDRTRLAAVPVAGGSGQHFVGTSNQRKRCL